MKSTRHCSKEAYGKQDFWSCGQMSMRSFQLTSLPTRTASLFGKLTQWVLETLLNHSNMSPRVKKRNVRETWGNTVILPVVWPSHAGMWLVVSKRAGGAGRREELLQKRGNLLTPRSSFFPSLPCQKAQPHGSGPYKSSWSAEFPSLGSPWVSSVVLCLDEGTSGLGTKRI